ncbi:MAG: DUF4012 domain-containing protein [Egibacteraceae bacterium]
MRRRGIAVVLGTVAVLGLVMAAMLLVTRYDLAAAQRAAHDGREALVAEDGAQAAASFTVARNRFEQARGRLASPVLALLDGVPVARQNLRAVRASAQAGMLVSTAGAELGEMLAEHMDGPGTLAPRGARIPMQPLHAAAGPAQRAASALGQAVELVEEADSPWLLPSVAEALSDLRGQLATAERLTGVAAALTRELPTLLGADGPRRYFFGAANPAELRGAGGFVGAYAILTVDDGRLSFSEFAPIQDLESLPVAAVDPPHADYASRYDRYGGAGFWMNINMTPDFPSAASAIESLYERTAGERLDGTIVVAPGALAALVEVTGPVEVPGVGQVTAPEIVPLVANEAFGEFDDDVERKRALGAVAAGVFARFLDEAPDRDPVAAGQALADAAAGGHLLVHAADPAVQSALEAAGVAGELGPVEGDLLAVVGNNAAANKVDFYTDRTVSYRATLLPDGSVEGRATVTLANAAPTSGEPAHVIGPNAPGLRAGDNDTILGVYCAPGCLLDAFRRDGEPGLASGERELGYPVYSTRVRVGSGESTELSYAWTAPDAWAPDAVGGTYRLTVRDQATIRPTRVEVELVVPEGMQAQALSHEMAATGRRLRWSGEIGDAEVFEVRLRRPLSVVATDQLRAWIDRVRPARPADGE